MFKARSSFAVDNLERSASAKYLGFSGLIMQASLLIHLLPEYNAKTSVENGSFVLPFYFFSTFLTLKSGLFL